MILQVGRRVRVYEEAHALIGGLLRQRGHVPLVYATDTVGSYDCLHAVENTAVLWLGHEHVVHQLRLDGFLGRHHESCLGSTGKETAQEVVEGALLRKDLVRCYLIR